MQFSLHRAASRQRRERRRSNHTESSYKVHPYLQGHRYTDVRMISMQDVNLVKGIICCRGLLAFPAGQDFAFSYLQILSQTSSQARFVIEGPKVPQHL